MAGLLIGLGVGINVGLWIGILHGWKPCPHAEAVELLRRHVLDWGGCDTEGCVCSHHAAREFLRRENR